MRSIPRSSWMLLPLWAALVAVSILARPLMPIDETRYSSVAWDMWNSGDYLVPHLNGAVYSHKPPLLFWMINAGWAIFGVHDWVARVVGPTFALFDLLLAGALARRLWPDDERTAALAGPALLAFPLFALYGTALMFDATLTCFSLLALIGLISASRNEPNVRAIGLIAVGIGVGILAKGPVIMLYVLPVALAAPYWAPGLRSRWKPFAGKVALGIVAGIAIGLAWAIPAAIYGGAEYREAILWKQTAGRVSQSFAHQHPFWFYVAFLPLALFPWAYWTPTRVGLGHKSLNDEGLRFCLVWFASAFILLTIISGKQVHYLVPILPAAAIAVARVISTQSTIDKRPMVITAVYGLAAIVLLTVPPFLPERVPVTAQYSIPAVAALIALGAGALLFLRRTHPTRIVVWSAALGCVVLLSGVLSLVGPSLYERYDTGRFARRLGELQRQDRELLHVSDYRGEFNFTGRLSKPLPVMEHYEDALADWCAQHPDAYVIRYWKPGQDPFGDFVVASERYRTQIVGIVRAPGAAVAKKD